jgi:hypothetical protein
MVGSRLSDSGNGQQRLHDGSEDPVTDYRETIAILQDEVARLEQELQFLAEIPRETSVDHPGFVDDEAQAEPALESILGRPDEVERLNAELNGRDETIRLLLDELSRVEAAQAATRSEWEHLAGWVAELEHRVEGQKGDSMYQLEDRLALQEQEIDALQAKCRHDSHAWEVQRQIYQEEIGQLRRALDQVAQSPKASSAQDGRVTDRAGPDDTRVAALEAEIHRLRAAWQELAERASRADAADSLDQKLTESLDEQHQLRRQLEQIEDERKRERLEHEANAAELQARLAQASLIHAQRPPPEQGPQGVSPEREVELRVRALRQHLLEVDEREKEERRQKQLINRLSRLWSRTGPR